MKRKIVSCPRSFHKGKKIKHLFALNSNKKLFEMKAIYNESQEL